MEHALFSMIVQYNSYGCGRSFRANDNRHVVANIDTVQVLTTPGEECTRMSPEAVIDNYRHHHTGQRYRAPVSRARHLRIHRQSRQILRSHMGKIHQQRRAFLTIFRKC